MIPFKKFTCVVISCALVLCMSISSVAIDAEPLADCILSFDLNVVPGTTFTDDVSVSLFNLDTTLEYMFKITSIDYLLDLAVAGAVKQGSEYRIAIYYENRKDFSITNADGTTISDFIADSDKHVFNWIVSANEVAATPSPDPGDDTFVHDLAVDTGNIEADAVFNDFLEVASVMENNSGYEVFLSSYERNEKFFAGQYAEYLGRPEEEFKELSTFEKFLWFELYVVPVRKLTFPTRGNDLSSLKMWQSYVTYNCYTSITQYSNDEQEQAVADAYQTIMTWQYEYFIEHGSFYNFMTGKNSVEETDIVQVVRPTDPPDEADTTEGLIFDLEDDDKPVGFLQPSDPPTDVDLSEDDIEDLIRDVIDEDASEEEIQGLIDEAVNDEDVESDIRRLIQEVVDEEDRDAKKDIWGDTLEKIKENIMTIIILIVLLGVTVGVMAYRKKKTLE